MSTRNLPLLTPKSPMEPEVTRWAVVTATGPLRVKIDGESAQLPFTPDTLVAGLAVNDRVLVRTATNDNPRSRARRLVVIGRSGGLPVPAVFHARATATQSISNDTETAINWASEILDPRAGHSTVTNTSRYTAPMPGYYLCTGFVSYAANATGIRSARWWKNGATYEYAVSEIPSVGAAQATVVHAPSVIIPLNTGDYVQLAAKQNSGAALDITFFTDAMSRMCVAYQGLYVP